MNKLAAIVQVPMQRGYGVTEAARYLGMHPQTLRELSDLGRIRARRVGRRRLFLLEDLDDWLSSQPEWVAHGNS